MKKISGFAVTGSTRLAGVIGYPIKHTLSPAMQNAAFAAAGIDAVYMPLGVPPQGLRRLLRALADIGALGANVTIPHKHRALEIADECSPAARRIGAVNTIVFAGPKLIGHNTDGIGFLHSLRPEIQPKGKRAVVVGCGGAGHAVAVSLADAGCADLALVDPNARQRRKLLGRLRRLGFDRACGFAPQDKTLALRVAAADLLVNASPLGMHGGDALPLPAAWMPENICVLDLVYGRGLTRFLRLAQSRGCRVIPGWHMLLYQGAESFLLWTGVQPPVQVMRQALLRAGV